MYLSHPTIERYLAEGQIRILPSFDKTDLRPVGIRLHLAKEILVPESGQTVDLTAPTDLKYREIDLTKEAFFLEPNQFILGATFEAVQTSPTILALLDGRSTVARLGLSVHVTAFVCDGAFHHPHVVVLEMKNLGNFRIRLKEKDPIAMMIFAELSEPVTQKMQSQYGAVQTKVTPPNLRFQTGREV